MEDYMKTTLLNAKLGTFWTDILNRLHLTQQRLSLRKTEITFKYWVGVVLSIPKEWLQEGIRFLSVVPITWHSYKQSQKYLRHCTIFWLIWPVHDLVLVIPSPPLIKVASNTRPCSKLGGTTQNGGEEGGEFISTDVWLAVIWSRKGCFFVEVSQHFCNWL